MGQDHVSGGVSVLCWLAALVQNYYLVLVVFVYKVPLYHPLCSHPPYISVFHRTCKSKADLQVDFI